MLESLRQGANSWLAKLLMGLLVLSFVSFGVRYLDSGTGAHPLAEIGGQRVTTEQYRQMFALELRRLQAQLHQQIDPQTAHKLGLDRQVLSGLLVDAHARKLNLGISDQALLDHLASQKNLQGADGSFDKGAFQDVLRNTGMTEASYIAMLSRDTVREQLLASVTASAPAPVALADALNQYQGEERSIDYFVLPASKLPAPAKAEDAKLKEFYDAHKDQYRAPEYRSVGVLHASPDDLMEKVTLSDDDIKAAYEKTKDTYGTPEKRHVQIMTFQDKVAADKAYASLKSGKDFMAVSKDSGLADKDVDRGVVAKAELLDKVTAEAAFKLAKDTVSVPIDGALATALVRVTEIVPAVIKTLDEVKTQVKDKLLEEKKAPLRAAALRQLIDIRGKIEDARGGGTLLKDMPGKFPFKYTVLSTTDAKGLGTDGKAAATTLPALPALLKLAFQSDVGVETEPTDLGKDGWAWVEVTEVKPSRQKTQDEVKADVEKGLEEIVSATALTKLAGELSDRANKGEDFAKLAKEAGGDVKTAAGLKRRAPPPADLPPAAVQLSFALPKMSAANIGGVDGTSRVIFRVKDIKAAAPLDEARKKDVLATLAQRLGGAFESEYLAAIEQSIGMRIDDAQLKQMSGPGGSEPSDQ